MPSIHSIVPDAETLLNLEIGEAAYVLLQFLATNNQGSSPSRPEFMGNLFGGPHTPANAYPEEYREAILERLIMAWQWLLREFLLVPTPGNIAGWVYVSSRGHEALHRETFDRYRRAALLPQAMLHPAISSTVYAAFLRGEYDIAIFAAFRALEGRVREVCNYTDQLIGVKLMRTAFDPKTGPLRDSSIEAGEQEAMNSLFAGAIGSFKNPTSHRLHAFDDPEQAVSLVLFASFLINQVDDLARANGLVS